MILPGKDVNVPDVKPPSEESVIDFILGHSQFFAVGIVAILIIIVASALGGAAEGIVGKLKIPMGVILLVLVIYGIAKFA